MELWKLFGVILDILSAAPAAELMGHSMSNQQMVSTHHLLFFWNVAHLQELFRD